MVIKNNVEETNAEILLSARELFVGFMFFIGLTAIFSLTPIMGQEKKGDKSNEKEIVSLLTGTGRSTSVRLADDMRSIFSSSGNFRLLPSVGDGDWVNIDNLLTLDTIDLAFVQFDMLNYFLNTVTDDNIKDKIMYITTMHKEEFHLLVKTDIVDLEMLNGKKINVGPSTDGTYLTATELFSHLNIDVTMTTFPHLAAYRLLEEGTIDAMAIVDGRPSELLRPASVDHGVRLLSIPVDGLSETYVASTLSFSDYPKLLASGDTVETIAVPTVLVAYAWPDGSNRRAALDSFTEAFFGALPELRLPDRGFHPKWQEVDLWSRLPGEWQRDPHSLELINPMDRFPNQ